MRSIQNCWYFYFFIQLNQRQEFDTKKIEDFIDEFNKAKYGDPSEREKDLNFKIPEEAIFNKMDEQFEDCDRRIKEIKKQIADKLKIEQELEKFEKENLNVKFRFKIRNRKNFRRKKSHTKKSLISF